MSAPNLHTTPTCDTPETAGHGRSQELRAIIDAKSIVRSSTARIVAPSGLPQNWLVDLRKTCLDPVALGHIADEFWDRFVERLPFQICGLESGSLPIIAAIQLRGLNRKIKINAFFVRKERKRYGLSNSYEGSITDEPVVIVDDTLNSATTVEKIRVVLSEFGIAVRDLFVIIDYENPRALEWLNESRVDLVSLFKLTQFGLSQRIIEKKTNASEFKSCWHFDLSGGSYFDVVPGSVPVLDRHRLYFGSDGGAFWALDQRGGGVAWRFSPTPSGRHSIRSSAALLQGQLYFGSQAGNVHCLDSDSGKEVWRFADADRVESSPCVVPELQLLFIGLCHSLPGRQGSVVALSLQTGKKLWEYSVDSYVNCSPVYDDQTQALACGTDRGEFLLFDPKTCRLVSRFNTVGRVRAAPVFDSRHGTIIIGTLDGRIYSIVVATAEVLWSVKTYGRIYSKPLLIQDKLFVSSAENCILVVNTKNGDVIKRIITVGKIYGTPSLLGGRIFAGSTSGIVYEIESESGSIMSRLQLPDRVVDAILFSEKNKIFFARTYDGRIFAFRRQA